jgi:acetyl esterase/lipase
LAGPYNFWPVTVPDLKPVFAGADVGPDSQPVAHVHREAPPTWLLTAQNDTWVSPELNSRALQRRLRAAGALCEWLQVPRAGHISLLASLAEPLCGWAPVLPRVLQVLHGQGWPPAHTSTVNSGSQPSVSPLWE